MSEPKEVDPSKVPYLPVGRGNKLFHTDSAVKQSKGRDNDDDYYEEYDSSGSFVAKYHTWHHMSTYPPFEQSEGWAQYSSDGQKIRNGSKRSASS